VHSPLPFVRGVACPTKCPVNFRLISACLFFKDVRLAQP
jgi:hypothetical protein